VGRGGKGRGGVEEGRGREAGEGDRGYCSMNLRGDRRPWKLSRPKNQ